MRLYPIELNIKNKKCVVVGGGKVAHRKVASLLECGAKVHVISMELNEELNVLLRAGKIYFYEKKYKSGDLKGAFLVVAATDSKETNEKVALEARKLKIMVNVIDNMELCDYTVPAITRVGDLTISVSTVGKSPSLAKKIRNELSKCYGREYGELLNILGSIRSRVMKEVVDSQKRKLLWKSIVNSEIISLIKEDAQDKLHELIEKKIEEHKK
ncbi:MAG: bifunctional precorrin-2 dehydrogenase/sirohydrochlorin ferrochelatase [bacterium]|nr:bifunctional precorrin-2 dehydrogenase/sirohydrochlorin ferrochelatase [bacterium]